MPSAAIALCCYCPLLLLSSAAIKIAVLKVCCYLNGR